jgi:hypothetical protein
MSVDPSAEPLKPSDAKALAREIVEHGVVEITGHAIGEMRDDDLQTADCLNLVRAGVFEPAEYINREWRYRVRTARICIVIAFVSPERLRIVTAWRVQR